MKRRILLIVLLALLALFPASAGQMKVPGTMALSHIQKHYMNPETGQIHAYPDDPDSLYLSESIGLYMLYLLRTNQEQAFQQAYQALDAFLKKDDKGTVLIKWRLNEPVYANALIDDVRILGALQQGCKAFNIAGCDALQSQIRQTITDRQKTGRLYADYYDWSGQKAADRLTLSYLTPQFFATLPNHKKAKTLLHNAAANLGEDVFFPEYADIRTMTFHKKATVHMVDQLLIAINRAYPGEQNVAFNRWMKQEWTQHQKLFGQYSRDEKQPVQNTESLAVYHYLFIYFQLTGKTHEAAEAKKRAEALSARLDAGKIHFFDYIHYQLMKTGDTAAF